jgi:hypothetical protein
LDSKRLKACTKISLGEYFHSLRIILFDDEGKPRFKKWNIWNLDETNNQTHGKAKTVDFKGVNKSIKREPVRATNTTFTFCLSAAGKSCTVQMIHKGTAVPIEYAYLNKGLNIVVVTTKSGWQTKKSFEGHNNFGFFIFYFFFFFSLFSLTFSSPFQFSLDFSVCS